MLNQTCDVAGGERKPLKAPRVGSVQPTRTPGAALGEQGVDASPLARIEQQLRSHWRVLVEQREVGAISTGRQRLNFQASPTSPFSLRRTDSPPPHKFSGQSYRLSATRFNAAVSCSVIEPYGTAAAVSVKF